MAHLLVSVRSASEARTAARAGAAIIDVKEPDRGSLGRASPHAWREVRRTLPAGTPLSVALGELTEWIGAETPDVPADAWRGIAFRKLGLARVGDDWRAQWRDLRRRLESGRAPSWIAVAYADWRCAGAPHPDLVLEAAQEDPHIVGVLVDTWDKSLPPPIDDGWRPWAERVRRAGKILALAGRLDRTSLARLAGLEPDIVAVRGAACAGGDRRASIDAARVAELARLASQLPIHPRSTFASFIGHEDTSNRTPCESGSSVP